MSEIDPRLREALEDLEGYLADRLAPLLVADSIEQLLDYPAELTAEQLRLWSLFQFQARGGETGLADLLFHALKKVQQLEELDLVPRERFAGYLGSVANAMAERCPPEARDRFLMLIEHLRETVGRSGALVEHLHRAAAGAQPAARPQAPAEAALSPGEVRDLRRFTLLLERVLAGGGGDAGQQALVLAAAGAKDARELEARLAQMRAAGVGPAVGRDLVRTLIATVPDWALASPSGVTGPRTRSVEAVRKAVSLAGDGARAGERWKDLLRVAAEEFNRGAFGRAVTLVDLADRMAKAGEIDARFAEIAKAHAHEPYDISVLLQAMAEARHRPVVRRLLEFHPAWAPRELLDELVFQPDQKRRRLLLVMLELWGVEARPAVVDRLTTTLADSSRDPNAWWYQRNLVYLLHRIPRPAEADLREEVDLVAPFSTLAVHPSFQKETFQVLAGAGEPGALLLARRLAEAERALESPVPPALPVSEVWKVMSAITAALVRGGTATGRRVVVEHGLARRPRSGETLARLRDLGGVDLSADRELVARLLTTLRELTPRKVLGIVVGRRPEELAQVARALAGTAAPEVREVLAELAERYPDLDLARTETVIAGEGAEPEAELAALAPGGGAEPRGGSEETRAASFVPEPPRASLSGDLEVFGLPGLLQNLQQSESSGRLLLRDPQGQEVAWLLLDRGRLADCRSGELVGTAAFFQVFEVPCSGSFEFARVDRAPAGREAPREMMGLLMEAMRRYDELQRLRALVPDGARLRPGEAKPTSPEEEDDGDLVRQVWTRVRGGATPRDCEAAVATDAYRVRTLLAHWIEQGALTLEEPPG